MSSRADCRGYVIFKGVYLKLPFEIYNYIIVILSIILNSTVNSYDYAKKNHIDLSLVKIIPLNAIKYSRKSLAHKKKSHRCNLFKDVTVHGSLECKVKFYGFI